MRIFLAIVLGLIGGFLIGIALSSAIGIFSMTLFKEPMGIKYLPYISSLLCGIILPIIDHKNIKKQT